MLRYLPWVLPVLLCVGCPSVDPVEDPAVEPAVNDGYASCPQETRVGGFAVEPGESWTTVVGSVTNGTAPSAVFETWAEAEDCTLLHPRTLFCDPGCDPGFVCDTGGECVEAPTAVDIGTVVIEGLAGPVSMDAIPPVHIYNWSGDLPFPAFAPDDRVDLYSGPNREGPKMVAFGVEDLLVDGDLVPLVRDTSTELRWTPTTTDSDVRVHVEVNIANHGGTPAKIVCETDDDGAVDLHADLVTGLLDVGYSGFPSVTVTRRSSDVASTEDGCIDFAVQSVVVLPADIPGLVSCSGPDDCPDDLDCLPDLTCG
jgi:hypothetical protein